MFSFGKGVFLVAALVCTRAKASILDHRAMGDDVVSTSPEMDPNHNPPMSTLTTAPFSSILPSTYLGSPSPDLPTTDSSIAGHPYSVYEEIESLDLDSLGLHLSNLRFLQVGSDLEDQDPDFGTSTSSVEGAQGNPDRQSSLTALEACMKKGKEHWDLLQHNLQVAGPSRNLFAKAAVFLAYYETKGPYWLGAPDELHKNLTQRGLGLHELYQTWTVYARKFPFGAEASMKDVPYETVYNPSQGVMIVNYAYKAFDGQRKLFHSDILYQTLLQKVIARNELTKKVASRRRFSVRKLTTIIRHNVNNVKTTAIILLAYQERLGLSEDMALFDETWRKWTPDGEFGDYFWALCDTDNIRGVVHMLNDYRVELGRKTIKEIMTRNGDQTDIWITLEDYKPRPTPKL